jgi:lipopolysaccharide export system protein LptA
MTRALSLFRSAFVATALACLALPASAQNTGVPNALQGFSQNRDKPVQIEAAQLEVRDKDKMAIFSGNVVVTQGDTVMRCKSLHVFYDQEDAKGGMKTATPGPGGKQTIKRLEARGGVVVTQKEQTATGETGIFEMKSNTVTLQGGVVVTQGANVLRGERLVVDLATSYARVEAGKGRVQGMFSTNSKDDKEDKSGKETKPADAKAGSAPKSAPRAKSTGAASH